MAFWGDQEELTTTRPPGGSVGFLHHLLLLPWKEKVSRFLLEATWLPVICVLLAPAPAGLPGCQNEWGEKKKKKLKNPQKDFSPFFYKQRGEEKKDPHFL
jgi:hypothetical protein